MTSVAAIVPTYNRQGTVVRAVESVLTQTCRDVECIVVDDGSTDCTRDAIARFGKAVRYIRQDNAGQGPARNRGVDSTDAEWVAFLDSDDVWLPAKVERQLRFTIERGAEVSFTDFSLRRNLDGEGYGSWIAEVRRRGRQTDLEPGVLSDPLRVVAGPGDVVFTSTVMMRRDVFLASGGYDPRFRRCQDVELHLRLALSRRWCFMDEALSAREWGKNASTETTYFYRAAALRSALSHAAEDGQTREARILRRALRFEFRALSGYERRHGRFLASARAAIGWLFPVRSAPLPSSLPAHAEAPR